MQLIRALLVAGVALGITGCEITAPGIKIKPPVEIKVEGSGGKHCPPGQAKKGNC